MTLPTLAVAALMGGCREQPRHVHPSVQAKNARDAVDWNPLLPVNAVAPFLGQWRGELIPGPGREEVATGSEWRTAWREWSLKSDAEKKSLHPWYRLSLNIRRQSMELGDKTNFTANLQIETLEADQRLETYEAEQKIGLDGSGDVWLGRVGRANYRLEFVADPTDPSKKRIVMVRTKVGSIGDDPLSGLLFRCELAPEPLASADKDQGGSSSGLLEPEA